MGLNGNNSFTGGIDITQGAISLLTKNAAGQGDIYVRGNSSLNINANKTVNIGTNLTQLANSTLAIHFKTAAQPALRVANIANLNGILKVTTTNNLPTGTYTLLSAKKLQGSYQKVTLNGQDITPVYQNNTVTFKVS